MKPVLFMFTRDLRLEDNTALNIARMSGSPVVPCFLQTSLGPFARDFVRESLMELDDQLAADHTNLQVCTDLQEVLQLAAGCSAGTVYLTFDTAPEHQELCSRMAEVLKVVQVRDRTLTDPQEVVKQDGTPYQVFTPYANRAKTFDIDPPAALAPGRWYTGMTPSGAWRPNPPDTSPGIRGGRRSGLEILERLADMTDYTAVRDIPWRQTSRLSAHLAFGTLSPRETVLRSAEVTGIDSVFVTELYWRDFWHYIAEHVPAVYTGNYIKKYDALPWSRDTGAFEAWCRGMTGFPIVDAGMRELNDTGFMHNRLRMITASFLTKDLHIDWKWGEAYFASRLIDYDPAVNNGNWQWAASTGCDAQPFFRVFNPWRQQQRFDPEAWYIRYHVPELKQYSPKDIHGHERHPLPGYPAPMADHRTERNIALVAYRSVNSQGKGM